MPIGYDDPSKGFAPMSLRQISLRQVSPPHPSELNGLGLIGWIAAPHSSRSALTQT